MRVWEKEINKAIESRAIGELGLLELFRVLPTFLKFQYINTTRQYCHHCFILRSVQNLINDQDVFCKWSCGNKKTSTYGESCVEPPVGFSGFLGELI